MMSAVLSLILSFFPGIAFSPDGLHLYVADTGMAQGFFGTNATSPSTM